MAIQSAAVIKQSVLFRCGELTDGTSPYDSKVLEYMNQIYRSILSGGNEFNLELGKPWVWARSVAPGTLILQPAFSTGTISVTNGSTTANLTNAPTVSPLGQWIQINETGDFYRISAVPTSTQLTLDAPYTGDTGASLAFKIYYLEYDLSPKIERLTGPMVVDKQQQWDAPIDGLIYGVDISNINENYPLKFLDNTIPTSFAQISRTPDGSVRIRLNAQVGSQTRISFDYIPVYSDMVSSLSFTTNGTTITTSSAHNLLPGDPIVFTGTIPSGLSSNSVYYVSGVGSATTMTISQTPGGPAFTFFTIPPGSPQSGTLSSVPILPQGFNQILEYGASFYLLTDKNDERSQQYGQLAGQKMQALIDANSREISQTGGLRYAGMIPRMDMFQRPRRFWRQTAN